MDQLGGGRYRLGDQVVRRHDGGLFQAVDTRLGRPVLVQCDHGTRFPGEAMTRLLGDDRPGIARLLDGGEDLAPGGSQRGYAVYPDSDWIAFTRLSTRHRRVVRATVAWDTDDLLVDPAWVAGDLVSIAAPVLWLPAPAAVERFRRPRAVVTPHRPKHALSVQTPPGRWTSVGTFPTHLGEEVA